MYVRLHVKHPLFHSDYNQTRASLNTQISNVMKVCPVGAKLFHADGQKD
jgi:hypothetical protein